eukprot:TRINITY_DN1074_c0_g1_i2.p1 TRINITY_DN1074_c0_g1~~TRINITY_DN1074_c0_g1_i2.p1  ORF type:complete len:126 (+),score=11.40 TRINITY_DN1074_c0_g1_i2:195-572(+)
MRVLSTRYTLLLTVLVLAANAAQDAPAASETAPDADHMHRDSTVTESTFEELSPTENLAESKSKSKSKWGNTGWRIALDGSKFNNAKGKGVVNKNFWRPGGYPTTAYIGLSGSKGNPNYWRPGGR